MTLVPNHGDELSLKCRIRGTPVFLVFVQYLASKEMLVGCPSYALSAGIVGRDPSRQKSYQELLKLFAGVLWDENVKVARSGLDSTYE